MEDLFSTVLALLICALSLMYVSLSKRVERLSFIINDILLKGIKEDIKKNGGIEIKFEKQSDGRNLVKEIKRTKEEQKEEEK